MEIEKTLFRVHERFLAGNGSKQLSLLAMIVFAVLAIISTGILIAANVSYENKQSCIQTSYSNGTVYEVSVVEANISLIKFLVSSTKELITLNPDIRQQHNFTLVSIDIPQDCYFSNFISRMVFKTAVGIEAIVINDIIANKQSDIFVKNNKTEETWAWSKSVLQQYVDQDNIFEKILIGLLVLGKINLGLFIQCAVASLYIKMTIICAPVFIMGLIECMSQFGNREIHPNVLYRAFPWVGVYMNVLDNNQNSSKRHLLMSFFLMLMLFYFLYLSSIFIGSLLLFYKSIPRSLDENFFGFIAIIEFASMLFFRTRSSIYFGPKFIVLFYNMFLFYVQFTCYGFFYLSFYLTIYLCLFILFYLIHFLEVRALTWSTQSPYTPTVDRPRCFYLPMFHLGWVNDIPNIWTMFYPLHGRSYFTNSQLAFVDHNYILLNNILQNQENELPNINGEPNDAAEDVHNQNNFQAVQIQN